MPRALITGANRGLGLEFSRQYLRDGWRVIGCCRNPDAASELATIGADLDVETSVAGMRAVIEGAGPRVSGHFLDHTGKEIPW